MSVFLELSRLICQSCFLGTNLHCFCSTVRLMLVKARGAGLSVLPIPVAMCMFMCLMSALLWPTTGRPEANGGGRDPIANGNHTEREVPMSDKQTCAASNHWAQVQKANLPVAVLLDYTRVKKDSDKYNTNDPSEEQCSVSLSKFDLPLDFCQSEHSHGRCSSPDLNGTATGPHTVG